MNRKQYHITILLICLGLMFGNSVSVSGQTSSITHTVPFATVNQNMWGPNNSNLGLNINLQLFRVNPSPLSGTLGSISSFYVPYWNSTYYFGAQFSYSFKLDMGAYYRIQGFDSGKVDVAYPIDVTYTYPSANTFNKGEWITITSNYTVLSAANITTHYPNSGYRKIGLDLDVGLQASLSGNFCFLQCNNSTILPTTGIWPKQIFPVFQITNTATSPDPNMFSQFGITGNMNLPYVTTNSWINNKCLFARGEDNYIDFNLDIFKFLSKVYAPFGNLSGTYSFGNGGTFTYNIFSAWLSMRVYNKQRFRFCPSVNTTLSFPTYLYFKVSDPITNTVKQSGFNNSVTYHVGDKLEIRYPCNFEFLEIKSGYEIDNTEDNFSNNTYDSIAFSLNMEALKFNIYIPGYQIFPGYSRTFCITYPSVCNWKPCIKKKCWTISWPPVTSPPINLNYGPLWTYSIPLGGVNALTWVDDSWPLEGFSSYDSSMFQSFILTPKPYLAQVTGTDILCKNDSTGSIVVNITNGTPPYTYEYDNFTTNTTTATTDSITGLNAGTHYVKVTDSNGCVVFDNINLNEPDYLLQLVNLNITPVSCYNGANGQAQATLFGGTSPYTYNWSNGSLADSATGLVAGNYTLSVIDSNNCSIDTSFVITQPDSIFISGNLQHITCKGASTGSISLTVSGGNYPYSYLWNTGDTTANLSQLSAGVYSVTVTDRKNCSKNTSFTLTEPATFPTVNTISVTDVSCFGGNNGNITVNASGGSGNLSYQYFDQNGFLLSFNGNTASNLNAGNYTIIISDSNGCSTDTNIVISEPNTPLSFTYSKNNVNCYGDATGSITVYPAGGTSPYTYTWNTGATTQNLSNLIAGTYTLTLTDANNCTFTDSIIITQPENPLSVSDTIISNVLCYGQNTGFINTTVSGGTLPYQIAWNTGETTRDIDSLTAGNYTITITDSLNCILSETYTITEPAAPLSVSGNITHVNCFGDSTGAIYALAQGGTPGYSYQWATQDSVIISNYTPALNNLTAGNYTLLVTDSNGCSTQSNFTVSQPAQALNSNFSVDSVKCFGNTDGNIYTVTTGGNGGYQYNWSNGSTSSDLQNIASGWYSVIITDTKGCSFTDSVFVGQPAAPIAASTQAFDVLCYNGNSGKILLAVSGGTPPYLFAWSNGETSQNIDSLTTGSYSVTITDANGCLATSGAFVGQPNAPLSITYSVDSVTCFNYTDGHINISISGGTMPYQMQWADSLFLLSQYGNDIYNLATGFYDIIVTDGNGCLTQETIFVPQPDSMFVILNATPVLCYGDSSGSVFSTVTGGTQPYSYLWNDSTTLPFLNNVPAGYYSLTVNDINNCRVKNNIQVSQPDPIYFDFDVSQITCRDKNDGTIYVQANGGVGNFIYQWANGKYGQELTDLGEGEYTVVVTDANNCSDTLTLVLYNSDISCIDIPNSITPNGDGINDTWIIDNIEMFPNAVLKIYNQWGVYIYETRGNNFIPWDGTYHNEPLPSATYYYILDLGNGEPPLTGPINIVR